MANKIPRQLYIKIKKIIENTGFSSVNEFVVFVLRELAGLKKSDREDLSAEEVKLIKQRLEKLGYL